MSDDDPIAQEQARDVPTIEVEVDREDLDEPIIFDLQHRSQRVIIRVHPQPHVFSV